MRIAIDIRPLLEPYPSGVSGYTREIVRGLVERDRENEYVLFCNSMAGLPASLLDPFRFPHVRIYERHMPNKLLNASQLLFGYPHFDRLVGEVDVFFLPNLNFVSLSRRCPLVVTVHDLSFRVPGFYSRRGQLWHHAVRPERTLRRADRIISVSESTARDIQTRYGVDPGIITVIPLGVHQETFHSVSQHERERIRREYDLKRPYVLFVGTIEERKNVSGVRAAWRHFYARSAWPGELVFAGRVAAPELLPPTAGMRGLGYIPETDKPGLVSAAAAVVYPSYYEGFGLPVVEALAAGKPVITSAATSLPEVSGQGAILVDPYNVQEIAFALEQVLTRPAVGDRLKQQSVREAARYSWRDTVEKTQTLISNAKRT